MMVFLVFSFPPGVCVGVLNEPVLDKTNNLCFRPMHIGYILNVFLKVTVKGELVIETRHFSIKECFFKKKKKKKPWPRGYRTFFMLSSAELEI